MSDYVNINFFFINNFLNLFIPNTLGYYKIQLRLISYEQEGIKLFYYSLNSENNLIIK